MIVNARDWQRPPLKDSEVVEQQVKDILADIKANGQKAINAYAQKFDGSAPEVIELKPFDDYDLPSALKQSIKTAAKRIERFADFQRQQLKGADYSDDTGTYAQVITPIERAGCYIPGGRYPLISTALMTLIPARVAGVETRIACSPSDHPAILAAASLAGATEFLKLGGAQAIAALAYGNPYVGDGQPVDIIVGPGNAYVNEAKRQLQGVVKIDGLAGPSELMALCDGKQPIEWLAYDALAQAEHDPDALSILVSDDRKWLEEMLSFLSAESFRGLLDDQQVQLVLAENTRELMTFSESYAAEHLMLCHAGIQPKQLSQYGSLFVGAISAVALGDYISGPNHTLPTSGYARQTGGLNAMTFLKVQTVQTLTDSGREILSAAAMPLAEAEGLMHHYASLSVRLNND